MGLAPRRAVLGALALAPLAALPLVVTGAALAAPPAIRSQASAAAVDATASNTFTPAQVTIPVGGSVTWTNKGGFHTVTGGDGTQDPASPMNGQLAAAGATYNVTFAKAGSYPYFCQPHVAAGMKGTVVVGSAGGATPAPTVTGGGASPGPTASVTPTRGAGTGPLSTVAPSPSGEAAEESIDPRSPKAPNISGNPKLEQLDELRASNKGKIGGFKALLWASMAALLVLCVGLFASTRPRRGGR